MASSAGAVQGRRRVNNMFGVIFGFVAIPLVAIKSGIELKWILLYLVIMCAGVVASD